ncbi:MAG: hypothetical protein K2Q15_15135 [Burkholderiales bacterium]|nr:hypothetical protein [Burkholderiales bacterium]
MYQFYTNDDIYFTATEHEEDDYVTANEGENQRDDVVARQALTADDLARQKRNRQKRFQSFAKEKMPPKQEIKGWKFDDSTPRRKYTSGKSIQVPPAGMRKFHEWRRLILTGLHPSKAAEAIGDCHYEKIRQKDGINLFSIRLTQEHRVYFRLNDTSRIIEVMSIGGHGI